MRRREFIGLVGGAFFAWPQCLLAQERKKIQLVGVLANEAWPPLDGLRHGLRDLGYIGGRSFNIVYRFAEGQAERYPVLETELVQMPVDVIITWGTPASLAARAATREIPIIMTSGDPVAVGLVAGLAHPRRNVTGFSTQAADLEGKRLELIGELLGRFSRGCARPATRPTATGSPLVMMIGISRVASLAAKLAGVTQVMMTATGI